MATLYDVSTAQAQTPEVAKERADGLSRQFIMDCHTHFLRDDTRIMGFVRQREAVGKAGWNPALRGKEQTIEDLKFANYYKEVYLDSDTKVALISGAPSEIPQDWFLTNEMKAEARTRVNKDAGSRRMLSHAIFTPGYPGWMEQVDHAIRDLKPDSFKGYTIGDNTNKNVSKHPWRMDDDKLVYPFYEKLLKAGYDKVCVHKGLFPPSVEAQFPHLLAYSDVRDVGRAAKDWPKINFIIYHGGYRFAGGGKVEDAWTQFEKTGRIEWVTDLAEIPSKYGVSNVYRGRRPAVRADDDRGAARVGGDDGHARARSRRRPRGVGHRRHLDGLPAVADRGAAAAGDPGGHAEAARLQAARRRRRPGEEPHLRRE